MEQVQHNIDAFLSRRTQALLSIVDPIVSSKFGPAWTPVVMAIIDNESGGKIGIEAAHETRFSAILQTRDGATKTVKKALGLMQVIPRNIADYATKYGTVYYEDMVGTTAEAAAIQIKIGVHVLKTMINSMIGYLPSLKVTSPSLDPDNLSFILMAYAIGQRPVQNMIQRLKMAAIPLTLANAEQAEPDLGKPQNQPYFYAKKILKKINGIVGQLKNTAQNSDLFLLLAAGLTVFLLLNR
jgi:hypothetical protein